MTCGPDNGDPPNDLQCTGLYSDFETRTVAPTARPYAPAASLWADGYDKSRWIQLPDGQPIDATNIDNWKFPVGTKVWKEFRAGDKPIETRLLWKSKADRWVSASYVWAADGSSATRGEGKDIPVGSATHHVPTTNECNDCHKGKSDVLLGIEAISLAQPEASGITLATLVQENRIAPAPAKTTVTLDPGAASLHVNCGVSCHNEISASTRHDSNLRLRVNFDEATGKPIDQWQLYTTTVNAPATLPLWGGKPIVTAGNPDQSILIQAMVSTDTNGKMPPPRRDVDTDGVAKVTAFIKALPPN